jgi:hypothetical protein
MSYRRSHKVHSDTAAVRHRNGFSRSPNGPSFLAPDLVGRTVAGVSFTAPGRSYAGTEYRLKHRQM